jgi:hypothetical protein
LSTCAICEAESPSAASKSFNDWSSLLVLAACATLGSGGGTVAGTLSLAVFADVLADEGAAWGVAAVVAAAGTAAVLGDVAAEAAAGDASAVATRFAVAGAVAAVWTVALPFCSSAAKGTLSPTMTFVLAPPGAEVAATVVAGAGVVAAVGAEEFPPALEPLSSRKFAAAVKSESVLTLKSPAACAVAFASGDCVEEVKASVLEAVEAFAGAELSGETLVAVSGVLCSVCD